MLHEFVGASVGAGYDGRLSTQRMIRNRLKRSADSDEEMGMKASKVK